MNLFPVPALRPARGTPGPTIRERIWRDQSTQPEAHEIPVRLASPHFARGLRVWRSLWPAYWASRSRRNWCKKGQRDRCLEINSCV